MSKKILSLLLALTILLLCGCGTTPAAQEDTTPAPVEDTTPAPAEETKSDEPAARVLAGRLTEYPCYALEEGATPEEMRAMAIQAHYDALTVNWYPEKQFSYTKEGPLEGKLFKFLPDKVYCGLPYTLADSSLLHFLSYYDMATGQLSSKVIRDPNARIGNACAESIHWGWSAVCPDIKWDVARTMTIENGCLPVGEYTYDTSIQSFEKLHTDVICKDNGEQVMFRSYAAALPADAVMHFDSDQHVMMVNDGPYVVYNDDGTINGAESYLFVEDQRSGTLQNEEPYLVTENGEEHHYSGRLHAKYTFAQLYKENYIPLTTYEFIGEKAYQPATVSFDLEAPETYAEFSKGLVTSNYNIVAITEIVCDLDGNELARDKVTRVYDYYKKVEPTRNKQHLLNYRLNDNSEALMKAVNLKNVLTSGETYRFKVEVLVATGETLTAFEGNVKF